MISNSTTLRGSNLTSCRILGVNVSVADIAYNNGADNTLVSAYAQNAICYTKSVAYNGLEYQQVIR